MGRSQGTIVQQAIIDPLASLVGVPYMAPQGATVHDAFPPFPPTKSKIKIIIIIIGSPLPGLLANPSTSNQASNFPGSWINVHFSHFTPYTRH